MTHSANRADVTETTDIVVTLPVAAAAAAPDSLVANKTVIRQLLEGVQRDGDFDLFERLFAQDYVDHTPVGDVRPDRNGTRQIYRTFRAAFPDWNAEVHFQLAEGDLVSTYRTYHGTRLVPSWVSPRPDAPPTSTSWT